MERTQDSRGFWIIVSLSAIAVFANLVLQLSFYPPTEASSYEIKEHEINTIVCKEKKVPLLGINKLMLEVSYTDDNSTTHIKEFRDDVFSITDKSYIEEINILYMNCKTYKLHLSEEDYKKIRNINCTLEK